MHPRVVVSVGPVAYRERRTGLVGAACGIDRNADCGTTVLERGIGAGRLSGAAEARMDRPQADVPVTLPDFSDAGAVARWRAEIHEIWGEDDDPDVPSTPIELDGVPCLDAGPADAPVVVYAHGGGFCLGSARTAIPITARLAQELRVISVDYRLAPEHPYPAAVDDVAQVCRYLAADRIPYALAGDSAGAGIVLCAAIKLRDSAAPGPNALALLSPHLDHGSVRRHGPEITELAALSRAYIGQRDAADPAVSPLGAVLRGLPPALLQASEEEPLAPQSTALSRRIRAGGGRCELDLWRGLWHAWHYHRDLPEADLALAEVSRFLLEHAKPR